MRKKQRVGNEAEATKRGKKGIKKKGERYTKLQQRDSSRKKRVNEWVSERVRVRQRLSHFS